MEVMTKKFRNLPPFHLPSVNPFVVDPLQPLTSDADPMSEESLFSQHIGSPPSAIVPFLELERLTNDAIVRLDRAKAFVRQITGLGDVWRKVTLGRAAVEDFRRAWEEFDEFTLRLPWCEPFGSPGLLQPPHTDRFPTHPEGFRIGSERFANAHAAAGRAGPLVHDLWLAAHADIGLVAGDGAAPSDPHPVIVAFFDRFEDQFRSGQLEDLMEAVVREFRGERSLLQCWAGATQSGAPQTSLRWSRGVGISDVIRFFGLRQKHALEDLDKLKIPYSVISRERIHVGLHALPPEVRAQFERDFGGPGILHH
jgi:hypothetical protein